MGDYGIGKTRIVATTCKKLIELKNKRVYFATEQSILEEIKRTFIRLTRIVMTEARLTVIYFFPSASSRTRNFPNTAKTRTLPSPLKKTDKLTVA